MIDVAPSVSPANGGSAVEANAPLRPCGKVASVQLVPAAGVNDGANSSENAPPIAPELALCPSRRE
jgi:hypothetical protein